MLLNLLHQILQLLLKKVHKKNCTKQIFVDSNSAFDLYDTDVDKEWVPLVHGPEESDSNNFSAPAKLLSLPAVKRITNKKRKVVEIVDNWEVAGPSSASENPLKKRKSLSDQDWLKEKTHLQSNINNQHCSYTRNHVLKCLENASANSPFKKYILAKQYYEYELSKKIPLKHATKAQIADHKAKFAKVFPYAGEKRYDVTLETLRQESVKNLSGMEKSDEVMQQHDCDLNKVCTEVKQLSVIHKQRMSNDKFYRQKIGILMKYNKLKVANKSLSRNGVYCIFGWCVFPIKNVTRHLQKVHEISDKLMLSKFLAVIRRLNERYKSVDKGKAIESLNEIDSETENDLDTINCNNATATVASNINSVNPSAHTNEKSILRKCMLCNVRIKSHYSTHFTRKHGLATGSSELMHSLEEMKKFYLKEVDEYRFEQIREKILSPTHSSDVEDKFKLFLIKLKDYYINSYKLLRAADQKYDMIQRAIHKHFCATDGQSAFKDMYARLNEARDLEHLTSRNIPYGKVNKRGWNFKSDVLSNSTIQSSLPALTFLLSFLVINLGVLDFVTQHFLPSHRVSMEESVMQLKLYYGQKSK